MKICQKVHLEYSNQNPDSDLDQNPINQRRNDLSIQDIHHGRIFSSLNYFLKYKLTSSPLYCYSTFQ